MTTMPFALIVDDEPDIRELLEITLGRMKVQTRAAASLQEARGLLDRHRFDLCLTDMRLPDGSGIELVTHITRTRPETPVAVITAYGSMEAAVQALKAGAFDFVSKPVDLAVLRRLVETALRLDKPAPPPTGTAGDAPMQPQDTSDETMLGTSAAIQQIRDMIRKLARSQAPVYISGESGSGKELAARLIHTQGPRREREFIAVNCGAIPQELMESEFFGHKKGSFTGAVTDKLGLFQSAEGGTLFLDEVADLPLHMQVKLLRALQEKSIRPVGAQKEIAVDVRIISATHKDLTQLVEEGHFRQDLFYRINVIELNIPPLRRRPEDIEALARHFLARIAERNGIPLPHLTPEALQRLKRYAFPGNVRELENLLERSVTLCETNEVTAEDLFLPHNGTEDEEPTSSSLPDGVSIEEHLERIERKLITDALEKTRWNRTAAARELGISFRALRYRLSKLGIN